MYSLLLLVLLITPFLTLNLRERQTAQGISHDHYKEINGEAERKLYDAVGKVGKAVTGDPHPEVSVVGYAVLETTEDEEHDRHDDRKRIAGLSPAIDREIHHCSTTPGEVEGAEP